MMAAADPAPIGCDRMPVEFPPVHVPRPYALPATALAARVEVPTEDGAAIVAWTYAPEGVVDAPGTPFGIDLSAPPVLMLHGNGEEHGIFGPVIDAVCASGRSVIAVDSRAQGASTRGTAPCCAQTARRRSPRSTGTAARARVRHMSSATRAGHSASSPNAAAVPRRRPRNERAYARSSSVAVSRPAAPHGRRYTCSMAVNTACSGVLRDVRCTMSTASRAHCSRSRSDSALVHVRLFTSTCFFFFFSCCC